MLGIEVNTYAVNTEKTILICPSFHEKRIAALYVLLQGNFLYSRYMVHTLQMLQSKFNGFAYLLEDSLNRSSIYVLHFIHNRGLKTVLLVKVFS